MVDLGVLECSDGRNRESFRSMVSFARVEASRRLHLDILYAHALSSPADLVSWDFLRPVRRTSGMPWL